MAEHKKVGYQAPSLKSQLWLSKGRLIPTPAKGNETYTSKSPFKSFLITNVRWVGGSLTRTLNQVRNV